MSAYLIHWGVKGQKWGVRRYQNKDGSLTPAGKARAAKQEAKAKRKAEKKLFKEDVKRAKKYGLDFDFETDVETGETRVTQWYNSKNQKIGEDYASRVIRKAAWQTMRPTLVALSLPFVAVGAAHVYDMLNKG